MSLSLILDILIVALLVPTITFAWILNGRLADLRRNRDELARLIQNFNEATHRAEAGIPKLRKAADDAGRALQDRVEKAQTLRDDLAFMVDRADTMLGKLEDGVQGRRTLDRNGGTVSAAPSGTRGRSGGLAQVSAGAGPVVPAPPPVPGRGAAGRMAALGAVSQAPLASDDGDEDDFYVEDERSEAERELLRALRSSR
ncbi:DUF6468 domain-containing protein [Rhodospira trueperi]|uniref:DUF6468 domain-containing protein n=1 Tax=Rhodospira trueperi TaxID=69960 RepID=A0A1G7A6M2_9PROT|nr:DUF6468 domain-containing protein [Rhodospira trueperi]SDE10421.1 hypothetical protein SAMN05421720_103199 [Rhodospira trueperi]